MPRDWKTSKCAEAWKSSLKEASLPRDVESDSDGAQSDPEEAAERDYARENGLPVVCLNRNESSATEVEKKKPTVAKINQAKAARKARCRGVSGSMTKKERSITKGDWETFYDDDYDFIEQDEPIEDPENVVDEQDENHFNDFHFQDFTTKTNDGDISAKEYFSGATIDTQMERQLSLDEAGEAEFIMGGMQLNANISVAAADLKM